MERELNIEFNSSSLLIGLLYTQKVTYVEKIFKFFVFWKTFFVFLVLYI